MKRLALVFLFLFGVPAAALSAFGTFQTYLSGPTNMGGGPNMIERSLFSSNTPTLPYSSWYTPGNGSPAISTADYYLMNSIYWSRPYDLDTMGSDGATIKAREGMRYVWMMGTDHPAGALFRGTGDFYVGYSNDPQIWPDPTTIRMLRRQEDSISVVDQNGYTQNSFFIYQTFRLVYNPDPGALAPFYIYGEGQSTSSARQHELTLLTTSDFLTATLVGPTIPTTNFNGWTSFGRPERLGVNNWVAYAFGKADASAVTIGNYKYTSTDGWVWTPDFSKLLAGTGPFLTVGGVDYMLTGETGTVNDYVSLLAVDANKQSLGTYTRISTAFGPSVGNGSAYPWQTWLQAPESYEEDGVASIYVTRGFPTSGHDGTNAGPYLGNSPSFYDITASITSNVMDVTVIPGGVPPLAIGFRVNYLPNTPAITGFVTGSGGIGKYTVSSTPDIASGSLKIFTNGGLWHGFIDQYYLTTNATAAASAAPLGVRASCAAGVATVQWNNSLPHQNYRVYKGSSAGTQATLVGNVTGTSTTDTPTANAQTWYKVVTMNVTEQKNRVVNVYCSANNAMVNKHANRVINDGGDVTKINFTFLASADAWLTSNNNYRYLNWWTDVRFGIKLDGSGFIAKIYDLGTTYLPRGGDYIPTTSNTWPSTSSNTSYSTTSFRGTTPSWINNANSAHGYFGNGRPNNIQRWNEITLLAAYQRPSGTGVATLFGTGQFASGMFLSQAAGASGNISFSMYGSAVPPSSGPITATVAFASATTAKVVAGVFDGSNMTAYLDGVAGTPVSASAYANPNLLNDTVLRGQYDQTSGSAVVLASGGRGMQTLLTRAYAIDNEALFTGAGLAAFSKGLPTGQVQSWGALYN